MEKKWSFNRCKAEEALKPVSNKAQEFTDFWDNKIPCWEMTCCPEAIHNDCASHSIRKYPCWEVEGTYCKWSDWSSLGIDTEICLICRVYLTYSNGGPIRLKLRGRGIKLMVKH